MMASNVFSQVVKNRQKVQCGLFYCVRMCNQEGSRSSSSGQQNKQSDATYGAPEYYQYNEYSFNDIHAEMAKYRLPRPSSKPNKQENK